MERDEGQGCKRSSNDTAGDDHRSAESLDPTSHRTHLLRILASQKGVVQGFLDT
jgi:hypothetical protein